MTSVGHIESRMNDLSLTATGPLQDALQGSDVADRAAVLKRVPDDKAMLRAVAELTRDLGTPNPRIFWSDFLASAFLGYAGLAVAIFGGNIWLQCTAALVSVLALYRAGGFIHEVTHVKHSALPGFRFGFNAVIGVPLLVPSYMYEGIHNLHHARTRYGTDQDPEYLPLALMKPWTLPLFIVVSLLAPIALLFRNAVLAPLSLFIPALRKIVVERYSGLAINPAFRRRPAEGDAHRNWIIQETAASIWSFVLLAAVFTGFIPLNAFLIFLAIVSSVAVLNQVRTLVAHLWENDGESLSVTAQFLDSVNVPPPGILASIWAPVGLRYHALHHLLPSVPYHALGQAHRRLTAQLAPDSAYHRASYDGLAGLVTRLTRSTFVRGA